MADGKKKETPVTRISDPNKLVSITSPKSIVGPKGIVPKISSTLQAAPKSTPVVKPAGRSFTDVMEGVVPYLSNLRNAFQTPPMPTAPGLVSPVTLKGVSMDKARADIRSEVRSADIGITDRLRGNVAEAYKASNLGTKLKALSDVSAQEAAANASIANQQAQMNLGVESGNVALQNQFADRLTERAIVDQREKSANIANAADKFMAQQNTKRAEALEKSKFGLYSRMFNQGVQGRAFEGAAASLGMSVEDYKKSLGFEKGGKMRPIC